MDAPAASSATLAVKRIEAARRVEELAIGLRDGADGDEDISGSENLADQFAIHGVPEVRRLRLGDQLGVRPFREMNDRSVAFHQRGGAEAEHFSPRTEIFVELSGVRLELRGAAGDIAGGQLSVAQERAALSVAIKLRRLIGFVDERRDVAHEFGVDRPFDRNPGDDSGDDRRDRRDQRKQSDKTAVQAGAGAGRPSRRAKASEFEPDQSDQDDDDQAVPDQQNHDDCRSRKDRRKAGENQEGAQREEKRRADDDHPKAAGRPAVVE